MLFNKTYVKQKLLGGCLIGSGDLLKRQKKKKTKSVRQVNLVGQVKTLVFFFSKLASNFNWLLKQTLVIICTWAFK